MALSCRTVSETLAWLPMFEFRSVRRSFPGGLTESGEAASFLGRAASCEAEVREREPWDFCEWIACNGEPRCAPNVFPMVFWREVWAAEGTWQQTDCFVGVARRPSECGDVEVI